MKHHLEKKIKQTAYYCLFVYVVLYEYANLSLLYISIMSWCNIVLHGCLVIEQGYVKVLQDRTKFTATYNI